MLSSLYIKNYALIEELKFTPSKGFNVVTGETGAGKSIIFDALGLVLGQRADAISFFDDTTKCIIEGKFILSKEKFLPFFEENDLDFEENTIIRREISINGRTRSFINDTPATLSQLKELGSKLVDIHNQNETIEIFKPEKQLKVVDFCAGVKSKVVAYKTKFQALLTSRKELKALQAKKADALQQQSYFEFLLNELELFNPVSDDEQLENRLDLLSNAEEIKNSGLEFVHLSMDSEHSVLNQLADLEKIVKKVDTYFSQLKLSDRFKNISLELKELATDIASETANSEVNETELESLESRFKLLQDLLSKHQVKLVSELITIKEDLSQKVLSTATLDHQISELEGKVERITLKLNKEAEAISVDRHAALPQIESKLKQDLAELEMVDAQIKFILKSSDVLGLNGKDEIEVLFSANKNRDLQPLEKVASGGEASRLALALKAIAGKETNTLIFDEIDTGVSGKVAKKVGELLFGLGRDQQVISITHSPQVASSADNHFYVSKETLQNKVSTKMEELNSEAQLRAIAEMLSGSELTKEALENAKTLIKASSKPG